MKAKILVIIQRALSKKKVKKGMDEEKRMVLMIVKKEVEKLLVSDKLRSGSYYTYIHFAGKILVSIHYNMKQVIFI